VDAAPELIVVAAFGLILGTSVLELPRLGCLNLHASLLPRYRGASPISAAILNGDPETGVTLMRMERGLDTGPMLAQDRLAIQPDDTTDSLTTRLSHVAANLVVPSLPAVENGTLIPVPQPDGATLTRPLVKADGWIDWSRPAIEIERRVRAMWSWPRAWTTLPDGTVVQVHHALVDSGEPGTRPGAVETDVTGMRVACGDGWLRIDVAQLPGGKPLSGAQIARRPEFRSQPFLGEAVAPDAPGPLIRPA
jgi:methionyl-tRNA formyltransferase